MPPLSFLVYAKFSLLWPCLGVIAGFYLGYGGYRVWRRTQSILRIPSSKIRTASAGLVEVSGLATGPHVITSPLKQADCYYYRSIIWESQPGGHQLEWVKIAEETLNVLFYLDDNTDKMLIDPRGAEMDLHCDFQEQYNVPSQFESTRMPGCVKEFLVRRGCDPESHIKVEEFCIKPQDFLFVLGTLSQNPGLDASITPTWAQRIEKRSVKPENGRPVEPEIIQLSGDAVAVPAVDMTQQQKIAAALAKAGMSNPAAWSANNLQSKQGSQVAVAVEEKPAPSDANGFDLHPAVVMMKGARESTFFISWRSQRELLKSLGWKSQLKIWSAPPLILGSLYLLLAHLR